MNNWEVEHGKTLSGATLDMIRSEAYSVVYPRKLLCDTKGLLPPVRLCLWWDNTTGPMISW